jgi:hypothetical protein
MKKWHIEGKKFGHKRNIRDPRGYSDTDRLNYLIEVTQVGIGSGA